jgi:hypothetical protein
MNIYLNLVVLIPSKEVVSAISVIGRFEQNAFDTNPSPLPMQPSTHCDVGCGDGSCMECICKCTRENYVPFCNEVTVRVLFFNLTHINYHPNTITPSRRPYTYTIRNTPLFLRLIGKWGSNVLQLLKKHTSLPV